MSDSDFAHKTQDGFKLWPWRKDGDPLPAECPKCGRPTQLRFWDTDIVSPTRYFYLACDGWQPAWFRRWWMTNQVGHFTFAVGEEYKARRFAWDSTGKDIRTLVHALGLTVDCPGCTICT